MQDLLNYTVREIEEMKEIALDLIEKDVSKHADREDVLEHFNEAIEIRTKEFWEAFIAINADFQMATEGGDTGEAEFEVLKKFMDSHILFFSETNEEYVKFIDIYENFYRALRDIDDEDHFEDEMQESLDASLVSMIEDIKMVPDIEAILQLREAVSVFEDKHAKQLLLEALESREKELTS